MSNSTSGLILVTGATGKQGGAVVRALLRAGRPVRALTRNPGSAAGQALCAQGVEVLKGDFEDIASLDAAMAGVDGVFSMQMPSHPEDPSTETRTGTALVDAAHRAGVGTFVHTSVARVGEHETFIGWGEGRWLPYYWEGKAAVVNAVKERGFRRWTILKPALVMENLLPPVAQSMFPSLGERGRFETANTPETHLDYIAAQDIGAFAAAAFADPDRFHGHEIALAAEAVTMDELAAKLTKGTGRTVAFESLSEGEAVARGLHPWMVKSHVWDNVEGYKVDLAAARSWGIPLTTLDQFIAQHRDKFVIG